MCLELSPVDQKVIRQMTLLFETIDRQTAVFAGTSGLHCKSGCGACCENPEIETTVAEMMPLAAHLWSEGQAEPALGKISSQASGRCIFYQPHPHHPHQGRCGIYAHRPGICRLFGFSGRLGKQGKPVLATCKTIKESQPQAYERTQQELQKGMTVPLLTRHSLNVAGIDPVHGQKLLPINQAIGASIEKIGYSRKFKS